MDPQPDLSTNHSALDNHSIDPDMESSNHQFNQMRDSIITYFSHSIKDLKSLSYNKELRGMSVVEHVKQATPFINWDKSENQCHEEDEKHSHLLELRQSNRLEVLAIRLVESALSKIRFHRLIDNERKRCYTGYKYELPPKSTFSYTAAAMAAPSTVTESNDTRYCYIAPGPGPGPVPASHSYFTDQNTSVRHTVPFDTYPYTYGTDSIPQPGLNPCGCTHDHAQFIPEATGYEYPNYPYFRMRDYEEPFPHVPSNAGQQYVQDTKIPQLGSKPEITRGDESTHHPDEAPCYGNTEIEQSYLEHWNVTAYEQPHLSHSAYDHWFDPELPQATGPPLLPLPSCNALARNAGQYIKQDSHSRLEG